MAKRKCIKHNTFPDGTKKDWSHRKVMCEFRPNLEKKGSKEFAELINHENDPNNPASRIYKYWIDHLS
jgi:hypothetical protein